MQVICDWLLQFQDSVIYVDQLAGNWQKQNGSDTITYTEIGGKSEHHTPKGVESDFRHSTSGFCQNAAVRFMPP